MITIKVDNHAVSLVVNKMDRIRQIARGGIFGMMPALGQLLEAQHSRRVRSEKTSPSGQPWKKNIRGTSVLLQSGALAGGFKARSSLFITTLGPPNLPYAYIHQAGGTMFGNSYMVFNVGGQWIYAKKSVVPARPYMGISAQNWIEIQQVVDRFVARGFGWL